MVALPPLRYLGTEDVLAAMPPLDERLRLAERTLTALATPEATQLPPKIAIHPRPEAAFIHAMPAHLRGASPADDLAGMKWVAGYRTNNELGLPSISAIVVMNDASTGLPTAILDGGPITAQRTAAVTGVALRHFGSRLDGRAPVVGFIGAGVQGHSHLPVLGHVLPGLELRIFDRHAERAAELAVAARSTAGIASATVVESGPAATEGADAVVTAASLTSPDRRQELTNDWLSADATLVPIDYDTHAAAEVARDAALFLVDQTEQFLYTRETGHFTGYPDPHAMLGLAILEAWERPPGRVVVSHLGVGLADVVFGDAIVRRAEELGLGTLLKR
jgi:ornithine cyclodeaminase/alanine dehydrogenase-like protein (mu-crystallin family)